MIIRFEICPQCEYLDTPTHCSAMGTPDAVFGQRLRLPKNATALFGITMRVELPLCFPDEKDTSDCDLRHFSSPLSVLS